MVQNYSSVVKKWDTANNSFCKELKNMVQVSYTLAWRFYQMHRKMKIEEIYHSVSENGELTMLTLWKYIEDKGISGYSRREIGELFAAIDINGDHRLSYS